MSIPTAEALIEYLRAQPPSPRRDWLLERVVWLQGQEQEAPSA